MSEEPTRRDAPADGEATLVEESTPAPVGSALELGNLPGRYVSIEEIGRGGMGAVVRAYDPKLEREVALKLVRRDVLDENARARVIREARAMAKLSHPNVVAVYDVDETDDGQLVLVMELVVGKTLRRFARKATTQQVLRALRQAGQGLAAAHEAGLLHRDFKPDNVLVGDDGRVRVTDFGLAKIEGDRDDTDNPYVSQDIAPHDTVVELTEAGAIVGTPRYMAPEQHDGAELTASTDQYGFCVAAWEMLAGKPPFFGEDMRADKRRGPPGWDHSRVALPSDLVAALRRGLAPDSSERFGSVAELLAQLQPRRAGRGRWAWGALAVAVVGGVAWQATRLAPETACTGAQEQLASVWGDAQRDAVRRALLQTEAPFAEAVADRVAAKIDAYGERWIEMHHDACEATAIRGEQSEQMLDLRMTCLRRARDEVRAVTHVLASADRSTVERAHELVDGLPGLDGCADLGALAARTPKPPPATETEVEALEGQLADARALTQAGRYEEAERSFDAMTSRAAEVDYGPLLARVALGRGRLFNRLSRYDEADASLADALRLGIAHEQWPVAVGATLSRMFVIGGARGEVDRALELQSVAEGLIARDPRPEYRALQHETVGAILVRAGRPDDAISHLSDAVDLRVEQLGADAPAVGTALHSLAAAQISAGRIGEAEVSQRRAEKIRTDAFGPNHPQTLDTRAQRGVWLMQQRRLGEALDAFESVRAQAVAALGEGHVQIAHLDTNIASVLHFLGRDEEAIGYAKRAIDVFRAAHSVVGPDELDTRIVYAQALGGAGQTDESRRELERVLEAATRVYGERHRRIADIHLTLGAYAGDREVSREHMDAALAIYDASVGPSHINTLVTRRNLAGLAAAEGKLDVAEAHVRAALAGADEDEVAHESLLADLRLIMSVVLHDRGEYAAALEMAEEAYTDILRSEQEPATHLEATVVYAQARWAADVRRDELPELVRAAMKGVPDDPLSARVLERARAFLEEHG